MEKFAKPHVRFSRSGAHRILAQPGPGAIPPVSSLLNRLQIPTRKNHAGWAESLRRHPSVDHPAPWGATRLTEGGQAGPSSRECELHPRPGRWNSADELCFTFPAPVANLGHSFMENFDTNYWGLMAMPLGLLLCFSPALLVWLKEEAGGTPPGPGKDQK